MKLGTAIILMLAFAMASLPAISQQKTRFKPRDVYQSRQLQVTQIGENTFLHTSYLPTNDFGNVPCNGVVVRNGEETIVFDTPANDSSAALLIKWITGTLHCQVKAVIPTHFHDDCLGGLQAFHDNHIPSYAYYKTIELAKANNYTVPQHGFPDSLRLPLGATYVTAAFFGEGHTRDNVVGYFPQEDVLFGGCLIKELKASKGYLGDANVPAWPATVEKVKSAYPHVKLVIPGHGAYGNRKLLDYTIKLFRAP